MRFERRGSDVNECIGIDGRIFISASSRRCTYRRTSLSDFRADCRQLNEYDVSEGLLRVVGDSDNTNVGGVVKLDPLVVGGVSSCIELAHASCQCLDREALESTRTTSCALLKCQHSLVEANRTALNLTPIETGFESRAPALSKLAEGRRAMNILMRRVVRE